MSRGRPVVVPFEGDGTACRVATEATPNTIKESHMGYAYTYPADNSPLFDGLTPGQRDLARGVLADETGADLKNVIDDLDASDADKRALHAAIGGNQQ